MFSISTVASSTRMPTASARPPSVMMLMVSPSALSRMTETKIDSGMEMEMTIVGRQSPRNSRIMTAVRAAAMTASCRHAIDGSAHEQRLIEQRFDGDFAGQRLRGNGNGFLYRVHNREGGAAARLVDRHQRAAHAILAHDVGLRRKTVANVGHIAQVNRRAIHRLHRQIVQLRDGLRTAVHLDLVFQRSDLGRPAGSNQVLRVDGVDDVGGRKPVGLQPRQVEINLHLAYLAAVGIGHGRAMHRCQLVAQEVLA